MLKETAQFADDIYLISAYDIAKGYVPTPAELEFKPELIVLDSGGYEVIGLVDSSPNDTSNAWTSADHRSVLEKWPDDLPAIFVSYDHPLRPLPLDEQISEARKLKTKFKKHLHCFLIKPESAKEGSTLKPVLSSVAVKANKLRGFDVVGVTDKGLGNSPMDRMMQIVKLRRALDEADCPAPIHVFGSLDPLSVCLYYLAGAEIFDGLTWLRYSFTKNRCLYPNGHNPLINGLHVKDKANHGQMLSSNYFAIQKLQAKLRSFARTGNFNLLPNAEFLTKANEDLDSMFLSQVAVTRNLR